MNLELLFSPCRIGTLDLRNRVVMAPMTRRRSPNGVPTAEVAAYYRRRAEGGVALIISEGTTIDRAAAPPYSRVPNILYTRGCRAVIEGVHAAGGKMVCQLWHAGPLRDAAESPRPDAPTECPSGVDHHRKIGVALSEEDLADVADSYARAATTAQRAGFDAIELHMAHGYLLDSFLWEATNRRDDRWGGRSPAERASFPAEVVKRVRAAVGSSFPVSARFSQWKSQDFAARLWTRPADLESGLRPLIDAGLDVVHCSTRRFSDAEFEGSPLTFAGWMKKLFVVPAIAVGSVGL